jgi:hypothetical protein
MFKLSASIGSSLPAIRCVDRQASAFCGAGAMSWNFTDPPPSVTRPTCLTKLHALQFSNYNEVNTCLACRTIIDWMRAICASLSLSSFLCTNGEFQRPVFFIFPILRARYLAVNLKDVTLLSVVKAFCTICPKQLCSGVGQLHSKQLIEANVQGRSIYYLGPFPGLIICCRSQALRPSDLVRCMYWS